MFSDNEKSSCLLKSSLRNSKLKSRHNGFQVLAALRYCATGSFLKVIGDTLGISKASISRWLMSVSHCLAKFAPEWITFPTSSTVEISVRVYW